MEQIIALLNQLVAEHFYGTVEIQMQNGCINLVRKTQTMKAPFVTNPPEYQRGNYDRSSSK